MYARARILDIELPAASIARKDICVNVSRSFRPPTELFTLTIVAKKAHTFPSSPLCRYKCN